MMCPLCQAEVLHPCLEGPSHSFNGKPVYTCGKVPDDEVWFYGNEVLIMKEDPEYWDNINKQIEDEDGKETNQ